MSGILQFLLVAAPSFVLVLGIVVFVHEFGHFRVGRWCGIAVKSFSIGLGPEWFGWTDKHGTRWKVSRIPLGGFVSWVDDTDGSSMLPATDEDESLSKEERKRLGHFRAMPLWKRAITVAAGPLTNFVFSIFAFAFVILLVGRDVTDFDRIPARIGGVQEHSAAAAAGLREGDVIVSADGRVTPNFRALQVVVSGATGRPIQLSVRRSSQTLTLTARPSPRLQDDDQGHHAGQGMLGVTGPLVLEPERLIVRYNPVEAIGIGAQRTWDMIAQTAGYVVDVFRGHAAANQIAGPTGIFMVSGQVANSALSGPLPPGGDGGIGGRLGMLALALLSLSAVLSVAVGIVNLLPVPVLDGGHLLFYGIEGLRGGRPLPPVAQEWAYRAGFALIASLFLFATWNDISRLLPGMR
ncbi:MAG: RIP metalloprotease [Proteobacteria bacterium]|nr:RIP metalloprotease [Pseudomonadota bacterium]